MEAPDELENCHRIMSTETESVRAVARRGMARSTSVNGPDPQRGERANQRVSGGRDAAGAQTGRR